MDEKTAISVLTQAVMIGQKHGVYSFKDSALILQALTVLNPDFDKPETKETDKEEEQ